MNNNINTFNKCSRNTGRRKGVDEKQRELFLSIMDYRIEQYNLENNNNNNK